MAELRKYEDVINDLNKRKSPIHLLLGNGFSVAYDENIFSYKALSEVIEQGDDECLKKLFKATKTKNFEEVMRQLDNAIEILEVFNESEVNIDVLRATKEELRKKLIDAINEKHPKISMEISDEKYKSCSNFLKEFIERNGRIFTTNYDLLLYWVLMKECKECTCDGFGKKYKNGPLVENELIWGTNKDKQNTFYLHGALHFFDNGIDIEKEICNGRRLIDEINLRLGKDEYPIFVTAGDAKGKLNYIRHNQYLSDCYENFKNISGDLIVYGFGFSESDQHIIDIIKSAMENKSLNSVNIGIYSRDDRERVKKIGFKCDNMFDAKTVNIWDGVGNALS